MSKSTDTKNLSARRQRRFLLLRVAVAFGSVCVALLIGELVVLLTGANRDFRKLRTSMVIPREGGPFEVLPCGFVPYATLRCEYGTNPRGYFDEACGINHVFNSEGWREEEHSVQKLDGTF